ncbi:hypothetical protein Ocin01_05736 [Orchesella cincta]|uniref:Uncharacterized protein n=1 Tax=Orchesella cincta TaxID=48709 RepID=A0A1D2N6R2_ORCCI|nr:hypothetical protein Ocin01_05736 [Orchesella cincta]
MNPHSTDKDNKSENGKPDIYHGTLRNNNVSSSNKNSYLTANGNQDDDDEEDEEGPEVYTGNLPAQYITTIGYNRTKVAPTTYQNGISASEHYYKSFDAPWSFNRSSTSRMPRLVDIGAPSTSMWDFQNSRQPAAHLHEGYKSVLGTPGDSSYFGRQNPFPTGGRPFESFQSIWGLPPSAPSNLGRSPLLEQTHESLMGFPPSFPGAYSNATNTKPTTIEGSQDKPPRRNGNWKRKSLKKSRETIIIPQNMPGYQGSEKDIDKLLEFVEGIQIKPKKDKKKEVKPKGNEM